MDERGYRMQRHRGVLMPALLEVRANVSFGRYRAGRVYEIDLDDPSMLALVGVGYFTETGQFSDGPAAGMGVRGDHRGADLRGVRVLGSTESAEVSDDVSNRVGQGDDAGRRKGAGKKAGSGAGDQGSDGGSDAGSEGNA